MTDANDQCSDTSSDFNWPLDHALERQQDDRVVFENVADQYVKGADVTAFYTILQDVKVNPDEDQIGLLRVGCTNIKECIACAPVQFNPSATSGATRHGIATFSSSLLPVTDDEFYQFCYIINKTKSLGSSIPFQLNCAPDDIDLLSNAPIRKTKPDGLIALADHDNDDVLVIHTKHMLTEEKLRQENRQLFDMSRRLELQKDEYKAKLDSFEVKSKEYNHKIYNEMQTLIASHKTAIDELSLRQQSESKLHTEYDACRSLCNQYQAESLQHAERCRTLEDSHAKALNETNQIRSQLAITSQLTKDQATQIIDLERRLMQSNELTKTSNHRQTLLEQQVRDLRLISEKSQASIQTQIDTYLKQVTQKDDEINALKTINNSLHEEINSLKLDNESLSLASKQDKELAQTLQQRLDQLSEQHRLENELAQNEIESLKGQFNEMNSSQQAYMALKTSFTEIEKRCVKHQKSEIEVKRQLAAYKDFVNDLQREVQGLTERLSDGAEEYKTLFRKYNALEHKMEINDIQEKPKANNLINESVLDDEAIESILRTYEPQQVKKEDQNDQENENTALPIPTFLNDANDEVNKCPMCYCVFPRHMTVEGKNEHIDQHLT
ncbi:unnamed protein product [Rotaria sp. Silwood2]|nr:unnamed protein product [Rotaria sp. Silwood2]CAF2996425.1 unnamed protein product [Rotaria sp. Silwood2]CAF4009625.1 unnamed protein product [Rotaria sp. Silwood2]CAF4401880.1 unnamed protein product [Rotaria sp. Silwood2]